MSASTWHAVVGSVYLIYVVVCSSLTPMQRTLCSVSNTSAHSIWWCMYTNRIIIASYTILPIRVSVQERLETDTTHISTFLSSSTNNLGSKYITLYPFLLHLDNCESNSLQQLGHFLLHSDNCERSHCSLSNSDRTTERIRDNTKYLQRYHYYDKRKNIHCTVQPPILVQL